MTPVGFLFLPTPPAEQLPIADFRASLDQARRRPSPNLLDTLYLCQTRQAWYRDYAQAQGLRTLDFVGSCTLQLPIEEVALSIRAKLTARFSM